MKNLLSSSVLRNVCRSVETLFLGRKIAVVSHLCAAHNELAVTPCVCVHIETKLVYDRGGGAKNTSQKRTDELPELVCSQDQLELVCR